MQTRVPSLGPRGEGWVALQLVLFGLIALAAWLAVGQFPRPKERHELITRGPFRWVRHPIYTGVLITALGACLVSGSWLALAFWLCLCVLFDLKARREEAWLAQRYSQYLEYRTRTRKFVPGVY